MNESLELGGPPASQSDTLTDLGELAEGLTGPTTVRYCEALASGSGQKFF